MRHWTQDLRLGFRQLARAPRFSAAAALTLALGLGATTSIFAILNGVLLRPLPYPEPDRIATIWNTTRENPGSRSTVSPLDFLDWRERSRSFALIGAYDRSHCVLGGNRDPVRLQSALVSGEFFAALGVPPALGRAIAAEDDRPDGERRVVLSHRLWLSQFGANPGIVGATLTLDQESRTVLGVMPPGFEYPPGTDLWAPLALRPDQLLPAERNTVFLQVVGRLSRGATIEQARAEMTTIAGQLEAEYPETNAGRLVSVVSLKEHVAGGVRPALVALFAAAALLLLTACANVAHLLLARSTARQREMAVRSALGAGRTRLVRHLVAECVLIALLGGAIGLFLSHLVLESIRILNPAALPRLAEIRLDPPVLGFSLLVALAAGAGLGLAASLVARPADLSAALRDGSRGSARRFRRHPLRRALVVAQVAVTLVLLAGSGLLVRSFLRLRSVDPGFRGGQVRTAQFELFSSRYDDRGARTAFYREAVERLARLPGVEAAALSTTIPLHETYLGLDFFIHGRPEPPPGNRPWGRYDSITPDYFRAMGIPLLSGRSFTEGDAEDAPRVMIINDAMARLYWPGQNPVGQKIWIRADRTGPDLPLIEIVGVVGDARQVGLDAEPKPAMFAPYAQRRWRWGFLVVRSRAAGADPAKAMRAEIRAIDKEVVLSNFRGLEEYVSDSVAQPRFRALAAGAFAAFALALAAVGIYGVVSYSVAQRTHEMGIRVAVGASRREILRLAIADGLTLVLAGLAIGLAVALALTRFLSGLLFGVSTTDPLTLAGTSLFLAGVALLACYLPARRACRVDPVVALRCE